MKRRSFFASIAAMLAAPAIAKSGLTFNKKVLSDRMELLKKYPLTPAEVFRNPIIAEGKLMLMDGFVNIISDRHAVRVGDFLTTNVAGPFYCFDRGNNYLHCRPLQSKTICGVPVIKIDGKYVQFKPSKRIWEVKFIPSGSTYSEGGVS